MFRQRAHNTSHPNCSFRPLFGEIVTEETYNMIDIDKMYDLSIMGPLRRSFNMRFMSATDAKQNFAALLDDVQRGPVVIRRQSRDQAVVISPQEYARLRGLAVADFQEFCDRVGQEAAERGLTERKLGALLRTDD
jgi:antitoxin Phd